MSEFSILKGVTVVISVTFGKIGLLFSVYNISKNYLTFDDSWIDIYKICQSVFFSSPVSHLTIYYMVTQNSLQCNTFSKPNREKIAINFKFMAYVVLNFGAIVA